MTEVLITKVREYLENIDSSYVSDAVIERWLNSSRKYIDGYISGRQIYAEDYHYDNLSRVYLIKYSGIMNLVLKDIDGNIIPAGNYTVDVETGLVTFAASPVVIPESVFATFTYHNYLEAVSQCWLYMAAKAKISGDVKLGDETLPKDYTYKEYCIAKYWDYKQSQNIQMER